MNTANYNLNLNKGWKFHHGQVRRFRELEHEDTYFATKAGGMLGNLDVFLNKNYWEDVEVPHDWLAALPLDPGEAPANGYKQRGVGWYYVKFNLPENPIEKARLVFDGILGQSIVYVNGTIAVRNFSGYNRFSCEIASYLLPNSENIIAIYVDATTWEGWWYEGAGLYRSAYIEFRKKIHIDTQECFVRPQEKDGVWSVKADLKVAGLKTSGFCKEIKSDLVAEKFSVNVRLEAPDKMLTAETELLAGAAIQTELMVENPVLWSPEHPALYRFICELKKGDEILETWSIAVGIRSIQWCPDNGMYLNGKPYQVKGICCHQDHAGVGAAISSEVMEYRIRSLKNLGINAYRCAHHAPSETLLNICDRLGMLVMVENRNYSVSPEVLDQLESMIRLSRNHASVMIYSLFNEEPWQAEHRGYLIAHEMREHVLALDDTRAVTAAMNGGILEGSNASDALDVIGVNYYLKFYADAHSRTPDKVMIGTENCPTLATRGVYENNKEKQEYNSYGDDWACFSESIDETLESVLEKPYHAGNFAWSGFDYYGEPQPYSWPSVMSHWGVQDNCGFPKDIAYHLAAWYKEELCVHLMPHWNWNAGEEIRVCAFTNAKTAELFVNGKSAGEIPVNRRRAEWKVSFEAGEICVKAYRGTEEVSDTVYTAGQAAKLVLEDVTPIGSGDAVRIINISVTDERGILIPNFDGTVHFRVGRARILGVGNGDPNGHQLNVAYSIKLFHGRAQMILTATEDTIEARCDGLPEAKL